MIRSNAVSFLFFLIHTFLAAFTWIKQPDNPTIVVEGVNNTNVKLNWTYGFDQGEDVIAVFFYRRKRDGTGWTNIAGRLKNSAFSFEQNTDLQSHYHANLPLELVLLKVSNIVEYDYSIELQYINKNGKTQQSLNHL